MRHATLYRKWRPRTFDEISGQEPVVRTLRRAIETDRVAHAYLFSGPRGTGKTSTAKVLAMGLNCEKGPTPEPDGTCESCRAIINNSSMDVLEMDAASNRGIDEIRELRDRVNLAPAAGRMKVYIIDEVHMLTTEAFNALLKMLEEPPEHVVFVLATTEKHKVLPTIISRCQSFDFRRPGVGTLAEKLAEIAEAEGIEVEPGALTIIAREGKGSFRDAEGLLDQLSSFAEGEITAGMVWELLGGVGPETLLETTAALHERRAADALKIVDRLSNEGRDLGQFVGELLAHLRRLMLLPHAPEVALAEVGSDECAPLEEQAAAVPTAEVVRLVEALGDALGRIKRGGEPKLELELTFLKLARDYTEPDVNNLLRRLEALEKAARHGSFTSDVRQKVSEDTQVKLGIMGDDEEKTSGAIPKAEVETGADSEKPVTIPSPPPEQDSRGGVEDLATQWGWIMQTLKARKQASAEAVFRAARPARLDENVLELEFSEEQASYINLAKQPKHVEELRKVLEEHFGTKLHFEFQIAGNRGESERSTPVRESFKTVDEPNDHEAVSENVTDRRKISEASEPNEISEPNSIMGGKNRQEAETDGGSGAVSKPVVSEAASPALPPERETGDDTIRSEQEVFALAREWFGPSGKNGGS